MKIIFIFRPKESVVLGKYLEMIDELEEEI